MILSAILWYVCVIFLFLLFSLLATFIVVTVLVEILCDNEKLDKVIGESLKKLYKEKKE